MTSDPPLEPTDPAGSGAGSVPRRVARNTAIRVVSEIAGKVAILALLAVMARELGARGFGEFAFALSLSQLLIWVAELGTDDIVARSVARASSAVNRVFWNALALKAMLASAGLLGLSILAFTGNHSDALRVTLIVIGVSSVLDVFATTGYATYQGLGDLLPEAVVRLLERLIRTAAGIVVLVGGAGISALAAAYLAGSLLAFFTITGRVVVRLQPARRLSVEAMRWLASRSFPIALGSLFEMAVLSLNTVVLQALKGSSAVGAFGGASRLVTSTYFIGTAFAAAMVPVLARAAGGRGSSFAVAYETGIKVVLAVLVPIGAALVLFAEPVTELALGSGFDDAVTAVRLLGPTTVLGGLSLLSIQALIAHGRQGLLPWISLAVVAVDLGLMAVLVPKWSASGAAGVTLASEVTYAGVLIASVRRVAGLRLSVGRVVYGPGTALIAMLVVVALLGEGVAAAIGCLIVYPLVLAGIERVVFPRDFESFRDLIRRSAAVLPGQSAGRATP